MRITTAILTAALAAGMPYAFAQRHELGLTLGAISGVDRSTVGLGTGAALQANYGYRLLGWSKTTLFAEVHFLANSLRNISSTDARASRDVATLYVVPGVRLKFRSTQSLSPYLAFGAGYALYEQSLFQISGAPNPAPRYTHRGTIGFGGGADFPVWRFIAGRVEVRDFYSGNPTFNLPVSGGQHNIVAGGGFVLRLGSPEM